MHRYVGAFHTDRTCKEQQNLSPAGSPPAALRRLAAVGPVRNRWFGMESLSTNGCYEHFPFKLVDIQEMVRLPQQ